MRCRGSCKIGDTNRPFKPWRFTNKKDEKYFCSYVGKVAQPIHVVQPVIKNKVKSFPKLSCTEELYTCKIIIDTIKPERADNYKDWFSIGSALYNTLEGSEEGLELFLEFSKKCPTKYDKQFCTNLWSTLKDTGFNKGTLIYFFGKDKIRRR
jgi:hypothetical protein